MHKIQAYKELFVPAKFIGDRLPVSGVDRRGEDPVVAALRIRD